MRGIPYMGSKQKLAHRIVNTIQQRHTDAEHFYDLFGGGGAISLEALRHRQPQQTNSILKL